MKNKEKRIVLITGGTSGIGLAAAKLFKENGDEVIVLGLTNPYNTENFVELNVGDEAAVKQTIEAIGVKYGRIDILINSAGYGMSGASELIPLEDVKKLFNVNFYGLVNVTNCSLKYMRAGSKILNLGSIMSLLPIPYRAYYAAVKAAVGTYSLALNMELKAAGIAVTVAHPGNVQTNFTANRVKHLDTNEKYGKAIENAQNKNDGKKRMSPEYVANILYKNINKKNPPAELLIGQPYKTIYHLTKWFKKDVYLKAANKVAGDAK